jgi:hypothetical protein
MYFLYSQGGGVGACLRFRVIHSRQHFSPSGSVLAGRVLFSLQGRVLAPINSAPVLALALVPTFLNLFTLHPYGPHL